MGAKTELRKLVSKRLMPLIVDLERLVFRHGYLRVLSTAIASLGVIGALGEVLGLRWLRTLFATCAAVLFVVASMISFAATHRLRTRLARSEALLHEYADAMRTSAPIAVREWRQQVTIARNGNAHIRRELVLDAAPLDVPRHLSVSLVYYGSAELSDQDKRRVTCRVLHAGPENASQATRSNATTNWTTSASGKPKLDVYIHLGTVVGCGDLVTVEWDWPEYSADLMSGDAPEQFDVLFAKQIRRFEHEVIFRDIENDAALTIRSLDELAITRTRHGTDVAVRFQGTDPPLNKHYGFVADYSPG